MAGEALAPLVEEYLTDTRSRCSPKTVAQYGTLRTTFLPWAAEEGITSIDELNARVLARFTPWLQARDRPLSPTSVQTYARNARLFLGWARRAGVLTEDLAVPSPRVRREIKDLLTPEEIEAMVKATRTVRDRLIVRLLAETGMRVGELVHLRCQDVVSQGDRHLVYLRGKTGGRIVGIDRALYRQLRKYIEGGRPGDDDPGGPVFLSARGPNRPLTESGVHQLIKWLARRVGIQKRVYPHLFRHSYATAFLNRTHDPVTLAEILGHGSLTMIKDVYAHLAADHVHDAMMAYLMGKDQKGKA